MVIYVVNAMINISKEANQILNIVKARENLRTKSEAIEFIALEYGQEIMQPEIRPEYLEKLKIISKQKGSKYQSINELRADIENAKI